ncbi:MAG: homocysteine S-methyltransferase family protein [Planctomycetes bacterium]|nr:homocysteine S-methyltransferase family protein [Planctomycetota bacterium]
MPALVLDGPMGTELAARGVPTPLPGWSAHAVHENPDAVQAIHADYARAGARVHTACTFRTTQRAIGERWQTLAHDAVRLARQGALDGSPADASPPIIAGSIAPLEDCYRPDLSPARTDPDTARFEHAALARVLVEAGCDLLLVETFPHVGELLIAVEEAVRAGESGKDVTNSIPVWASLTPGYLCDLLSPSELAAGAARAIDAGAAAVLVNCVPATRALEYVQALVGVAKDTPVGVYANAGSAQHSEGWTTVPIAAERYADLAADWLQAGASIIGGCCGTGPTHVAYLARRFA